MERDKGQKDERPREGVSYINMLRNIKKDVETGNVIVSNIKKSWNGKAFIKIKSKEEERKNFKKQLYIRTEKIDLKNCRAANDLMLATNKAMKAKLMRVS